MSYINDLRKYVGHNPILTAGVGLLVFNSEDKILMQLRTDYNLWGFPGGSMELGESFEDVAIRELKEELNLNLDHIQYEMKYLECPTEKRSVYGFIATGKLDMSKEELNIYFENYKKYLKVNDLELEFSRLIFLNKSKAIQELDKLDNPKREYLRDLIEISMQK